MSSNKYQKYSSVNNLSLITGKNMKYNIPKKCLNVIDFIKQKNKFFIENSFDVRGTREFLASKEVAMREIKLNDEIIKEKKNKKDCSHQSLLALDFNNYKEIYLKNKSAKMAGKYSISPKKSRTKSKKLSLKDKETIQNKKRSSKKTKDRMSTPKSRNKSIKENSSYLDSNKDFNILYGKKIDDDDNNIYKFFIDNAKETEENFQKKLKKEIKKVESIKKKNKKIHRKSLTKDEIKYKRPKRMNSVIVQKETQSLFMFSEYSKNLMVNDDISISSIGFKNERVCLSPKKINKKKVKRAYGSIQMNNKQIKERIRQKIEKNIEDNNNNEIKKMEINSDKDSIISILSDLM